jgi:hypothetical protein
MAGGFSVVRYKKQIIFQPKSNATNSDWKMSHVYDGNFRFRLWHNALQHSNVGIRLFLHDFSAKFALFQSKSPRISSRIPRHQSPPIPVFPVKSGLYHPRPPPFPVIKKHGKNP